MALKKEIPRLKLAIAGNPNSGKSTIFNALTGGRQKVSNYPGVTVEQKIGKVNLDGVEMEIIDLPGTYSLTAISEEEVVARNYIIENQPDIVIDIVDASNLERNLYLTVQLAELGVPIIVVLNMMDIARSRGMKIDTDRLSQLLGLPTVQTIGNKKEGIDQLKKKILEVVQNPEICSFVKVNYGTEVEKTIATIENRLSLPERYKKISRWFTIKLIENDSVIVDLLKNRYPQDNELWETLEAEQNRLVKLYRDPPEILIADRRYGYISGIIQEVVKFGASLRHDISDYIDMIVINPVIGLPVFLVVMYLIFYLTFTLGDYPTHLLAVGFTKLGDYVSSFWPAGTDSPLKSLLVEGIIGGVGGVITFLPNILLLFLGIAILEDTGYLARAAFIMDRFMHKIGLHGKSFIPMLIGFGCSVPAILATRILDDKRERFITIMIIPLMSCSARLPIYALFIPAFFPKEYQAPMLWLIYITGIVFAIILAKILGAVVFKGESIGLVMELPPYRLPTINVLLSHMWNRSWLYLKKAGTIILAISIILWALMSYPKPSANKIPPVEDKRTYELKYSIAGRLGDVIAKVSTPLGFDWRVGTALVGAIAAKEVFVAQMGILFSVDSQDEDEGKIEETLREKLQRTYTPLQAFCIMIFCLLSAPCLATLAVTKQETGSWAYAIGQFLGLTVLAYFVTLIVYQVGAFLGF